MEVPYVYYTSIFSRASLCLADDVSVSYEFLVENGLTRLQCGNIVGLA
mgnify:CR=1 FL=1